MSSMSVNPVVRRMALFCEVGHPGKDTIPILDEDHQPVRLAEPDDPVPIYIPQNVLGVLKPDEVVEARLNKAVTSGLAI